MLLNREPLISFVITTVYTSTFFSGSMAAILLSLRSTVSNSPLAVGDIPIERIGRLSHSVQEVAHIVGRNTETEVLRHPDCHLIIREIIAKKLVKVVDVLNVPNRGPWHLRNLIAPLTSRNRYHVPVDFLREHQ